MSVNGNSYCTPKQDLGPSSVTGGERGLKRCFRDSCHKSKCCGTETYGLVQIVLQKPSWALEEETLRRRLKSNFL
jgi:hypothetical protein